MRVICKDNDSALALVKRMVFLAYNAAGGAMGMGVFQQPGSTPDEERVWKQAYNQLDYVAKHNDDNEVYCDYVFGSCMKWGCEWNENVVMIPDRTFRPTYQNFLGTYKDNKALVKAAAKELALDISIEDGNDL